MPNPLSRLRESAAEISEHLPTGPELVRALEAGVRVSATALMFAGALGTLVAMAPRDAGAFWGAKNTGFDNAANTGYWTCNDMKKGADCATNTAPKNILSLGHKREACATNTFGDIFCGQFEIDDEGKIQPENGIVYEDGKERTRVRNGNFFADHFTAPAPVTSKPSPPRKSRSGACYMKNPYKSGNVTSGDCSNGSGRVYCSPNGRDTQCSGPGGSYLRSYNASISKACGCD